jgi:8-oxo-dGTP pyrophosphatase MutT (NUDIX family)
MTRKHGPWTIKESTQKFRHKLIEVYEDQVIKPDGSHGVYATVRVKPGVAVLALDADNTVYLAREFRYAIGANSLEVVSGAIDDGEQPIDSAKRELKEELGIEAGEWTQLGRVDPITSIIDSPSTLFLALDLTFTEKKQEGSERIEAVKVSLDEAARMVIDGEITHGTSCVLILRARARKQAVSI